MSRRSSVALLVLTLATAGCGREREAPAPVPRGPVRPLLIAHAGGGIDGHAYTNSREALDRSYAAGFRAFEVDFNWTSDGKLVLIHDWERLGIPAGPGVALPTLEEFARAPTPEGLDSMTADDLLAWLGKHPDARAVTDAKERNLDALRVLAASARRTQLIPQVYAREELAPVRALGFEDVIFTLYRTDLTDDAVVAFAREEPLFAVTMPARRAADGLAARLAALDVWVYAHTVNRKEEWAALSKAGVRGLYTDFLLPADLEH